MQVIHTCSGRVIFNCVSFDTVDVIVIVVVIVVSYVFTVTCGYANTGIDSSISDSHYDKGR
jgi:hypothetical protein